MAEKDLYTKLEEEHFEMFREQSKWEEYKPYVFALTIVLTVVMPWAVGVCMLAKWVIF